MTSCCVPTSLTISRRMSFGSSSNVNGFLAEGLSSSTTAASTGFSLGTALFAGDLECLLGFDEPSGGPPALLLRIGWRASGVVAGAAAATALVTAAIIVGEGASAGAGADVANVGVTSVAASRTAKAEVMVGGVVVVVTMMGASVAAEIMISSDSYVGGATGGACGWGSASYSAGKAELAVGVVEAVFVGAAGASSAGAGPSTGSPDSVVVEGGSADVSCVGRSSELDAGMALTTTSGAGAEVGGTAAMLSEGMAEEEEEEPEAPRSASPDMARGKAQDRARQMMGKTRRCEAVGWRRVR